jgi:predicted ATPase
MASGSRKVVSSRSPFVGREKERAALSERLESAGQGEGGVVLVSGEPGIGKTRLLGEFAEHARVAGWLVLSGRAYDTAGMPPYLPFVEALRQQIRARSKEDVTAALGDSPAVVELLPELRPKAPPGTAGPTLSAEAERFRIFEDVSHFLLRLTDLSPGVVFLLDDLHWADRSTLQLLLHLTRKLAGTRLLVLVAYRSEGVARSPACLPIWRESAWTSV